MFARLLVLMLSVFLLTAAACGSDDNDSDGASDPTDGVPTAATTADASDGDADQSQPPSGGGGDGFIQINGDSVDVREVMRCEPFFEGDGNLDLTALGQGATLFINVNDSSTSLGHELSLQGASAGGVFSAAITRLPDGTWYDEEGNAASGPPFTISGDRISGSMTLLDAVGGTGTVDVSFDVSIPTEIRDCSLQAAHWPQLRLGVGNEDGRAFTVDGASVEVGGSPVNNLSMWYNDDVFTAVCETGGTSAFAGGEKPEWVLDGKLVSIQREFITPTDESVGEGTVEATCPQRLRLNSPRAGVAAQ